MFRWQVSGLAGPIIRLTLSPSVLALEYRLHFTGGCVETGKERIGQKIAFLRAGWWIIHFAGIAAVYALGHFLW